MKPVFRSDSTVSVMELIASAHASVRHDAGFFLGRPLPSPGASGQALYGMTRARVTDRGHLETRSDADKLMHIHVPG